MSATNLHRIVIEDCLAYFNQEGIPAHEDNGSVYVTIQGLEIQISDAEATYRATYSNQKLTSKHHIMKCETCDGSGLIVTAVYCHPTITDGTELIETCDECRSKTTEQ